MESTDKSKKAPEEKVSTKKASKSKSIAAKGVNAKKGTAGKSTVEKAAAVKADAAKIAAEKAVEVKTDTGDTTAETAAVEKSAAATPEKVETPEKVAKPVKAVNPEKIVIELAKKGASGSEIGITLRDQYGVGSVKKATGKTMGQILKENKLGGDVPGDLRDLLKRRTTLLKHNGANRGDISAKRGLQVVEARIRRLSKYYQKNGILSKGWKHTKAGEAR